MCMNFSACSWTARTTSGWAWPVDSTATPAVKSMKRLPATEMSKDIDATTENKVQHLAQDSVHQSEVVTEAMAEVWIKQGNKEKAIETYNKLGLLNPSKKAYFADLIENLKRS